MITNDFACEAFEGKDFTRKMTFQSVSSRLKIFLARAYQPIALGLRACQVLV